ncbi:MULTISPECIES: ABC transporter ATP-binding protein [Mameliella]|uniref:ABC transporter ATP-binding protein n=1 Tax=Mameliella TaxID=1434019 RepID=UPI000B532A64|nr:MULTISPECIES: ABC transporter ATP-binding protein [Mameliella]MCR9274423.1 ABC transporter ATP-binding protein/permease [Paracoccaceae bacterium]OWV63091.1 hypothetical protein CDZ98_02680 [Mameliella alba]
MKALLRDRMQTAEWRRFGRVLGLLRASRGSVFVVVALGLVSSLFEGISLYLFLPILAHLPGQSGAEGTLPALLGWVDDWFPPDWVFTGLLTMAVLGIVLKNAVNYLNVAVFAFVNCRAGHLLRSKLNGQILMASSSHINQTQTGEIANAMISETWRSVEVLGDLFRILVNACALVVLLGVLAIVSWQATLLAMGVGGLFMLVSRVMTDATNRASAEAVASNTDFIGRFWETMEGLPAIRQYDQAAAEGARFDALSRRVEKVYLRMQLIQNVIGPSFEVLVAIFVAVLLSLMFHFGIGGPSVAVFLLILFRAARSLRGVMVGVNKMRQLSYAVEEVGRVGEACAASALPSGNRPFSSLAQGIRLRDVSYRYPGRSELSLDGIDIEIPAGGSVAFVGHSGSGKTTVARLLGREFDPTQGHVEVDGMDLREIDLGTWRRRVAIVPQVTHIFDGTVAENIAYGAQDASEAQIRQVAHQAQCDTFVQALPKGFDTRIGAKGVLLSGGQRQRIAFARALLTRPDVLILDEATNELDTRTETAIMENLRRSQAGKTLVIIAHRLSTVTWCDSIVVLSEGRLVETGAPAELMGRAGGAFAGLIRNQH